jgi:hypothetical protein
MATNSRQWTFFLTELNRQGIDFECIQHADEASRVAVLNSIPGLTALDRAVVSSTWTKLAAADGRSGAVAASPSSQFGAAAQIGGSGPSSPNGALNPPSSGMMPLRPSLMATVDVGQLRAALNRGDCAIALPLASDLLQQDPLKCVEVLREYLPHITTEQMKSMLGVGCLPAAMDARSLPVAGGMGAAGGWSPIPSQQHHSSVIEYQGSQLMSPPGRTRQGTTGAAASSPIGGSGVESRPSGSLSPAWTGASLNGNPIPAGQVLTTQSLTAQYGAGFYATCNGRVLNLPYSAQRGDNITVRSISSR